MAKGLCSRPGCGEPRYSTSGYCKVHHREAVAEWKRNHLDRVRELGRKNKAAERARKGPEKVRQAWKDWYDRNTEHRRAWQRDRRYRNPKRTKMFDANPYTARHAVEWALKKGYMQRALNCENCGAERRTDAHHETYTKPFEVKWLCRPCHVNLHLERGEQSIPEEMPILVSGD